MGIFEKEMYITKDILRGENIFDSTYQTIFGHQTSQIRDLASTCTSNLYKDIRNF